MYRAGAHPGISAILAKAARFCRDRRGVAAIEFAFIVPVLLIMYFITMEASQAIETSKKVSRIGSMVADLVTQQPSVKTADLDAIMKIGTSTLQPYNRSTPTIIITGIQITDEASPKVKVAWSRKLVGTTYSADALKDSITTVPATLNIRNTFLVRVESDLGYEAMIAWSASGSKALGLTSAFNKIPMGETYYLRPRRGPSVPCSDC
ncbi:MULTISPECIES: TadE/TadG family type IV pilus assembly protein [unclassified Mesorhizobium]|uniref:TadE/TadG family type IV pilus assembly protein n=1 Tax=unclassified Mesorhizobium TaxID=325217 RepID=UPI000FCB4B7F|nr:MULTISPECIES: TadE/TadG family type IV pilus assembly protein [unclassified Mesorhizobium]TIT76849.1 MAG: pilus assembly protein [Mesorhizobium sp.]TGP20514.1 pilus assembly protein [Mesorhizobium sp. M1D.F.Ca.ET.231.01.1.1]TGP28510.1 pilus assembly protein [Mesorhizobium sp. M1D.F.Ca.ET.234.01.1.1]TGS42659.1 pilus assembly protein [Mesorhizobium sp. M1D.F.Ca.ET.184.01.1.1]TGS59708.1 pilus assembly protein [Mesorhizobium sp. M1D.F.Ca.ET.183.01.1.1]